MICRKINKCSYTKCPISVPLKIWRRGTGTINDSGVVAQKPPVLDHIKRLDIVPVCEHCLIFHVEIQRYITAWGRSSSVFVG